MSQETKLYANTKTVGLVAVQWLGVLVGYILGLAIANVLLPVPKQIIAATPPAGLLSMPWAILLNGAVNASVLLWAGRRSTFRGVGMWMQLCVLSFGAQTFLTQIETAYFLSAFPLLQGTFELYRLVLRGGITSLAVTFLVTLLVGGFARTPRKRRHFTVRADRAVKAGSWLAGVYVRSLCALRVWNRLAVQGSASVLRRARGIELLRRSMGGNAHRSA